jgi:hypothetical protein
MKKWASELNRNFSNDQKTHEEILNSLAIKEMQNKTTF